MNAAPTKLPQNPAVSPAQVDRKTVIGFVLLAVMLPVLALFVPAGHWDWIAGWVYVCIVVFFTLLSHRLMTRKFPDLGAERVRSLTADDAAAWDKRLIPFIVMVGPITALIVAGLDERGGWSPRLPLAVQGVALGVFVLGFLVTSWAMVSNRFFSGTVRIQSERGHMVETGGPYRFVRHPAYAGSLAVTLFTPVLLGSLWALIPAVLTALLIVVRTALEDRTLRATLDGYDDYASRVRSRLFLGIW